VGPRFTCRLVDLARLDEVPFILFFCVWVQIPKQRVHANGFLLKLFRLGLFEGSHNRLCVFHRQSHPRVPSKISIFVLAAESRAKGVSL